MVLEPAFLVLLNKALERSSPDSTERTSALACIDRLKDIFGPILDNLHGSHLCAIHADEFIAWLEQLQHVLRKPSCQTTSTRFMAITHHIRLGNTTIPADFFNQDRGGYKELSSYSAASTNRRFCKLLRKQCSVTSVTSQRRCLSNCLECGAVGAALTCSRCKQAKYCSRGCQASHWPSHKLECKNLEAATH